MKLTLRAARKLETKIKARIAEGIDFDVKFNAFETTNLSDALAAADVSVIGSVDQVLQLVTIRAGIRRQIQELNEASGVNAAIADRAMFLDQLAVWKRIQGLTENKQSDMTAAALQSKLAAIKQTYGNNGSSIYSDRDTITLTRVPDSVRREVDDSIYSLQSKVDQLDDAILELNMGTKITLSDEDVSFLTKQNLL